MDRHHLLDLLICPATGKRLDFIELSRGQGVLAENTGIIYPIINGIVVMKPVAEQTKKLCHKFLYRNSGELKVLAHYDEAETIAALGLDYIDEQTDWHAGEMAYWESRFQRYFESSESENPGWNRTLPRKRLLDRLQEDIDKGVILEIGCGFSHTLADVYGTDIPNYIGMDLSFYACAIAKKMFPNGLFIQAMAEKPPLRKESLDAIVSYGVFHHLPGHEENIITLLPLLKPGGLIIGSDPVPKPRIPRLSFKMNKNKLQLSSDKTEINLQSGMSPHNEWIQWDNLQEIIKGKGYVLDSFFEYSPLRHLLVKKMYDKHGLRTKAFTQFILTLDKGWLKTIGKMHRSLGPSAVHYILQKY